MRFALTIAALVIVGCSKPSPTPSATTPANTVTFECMGTTGSLKVRGKALPEGWENEVEILHELEAIFSHWKPESALSQLNASTSLEPLPVPIQLAEITALSHQYARRTDGAFDITTAPLVDLWGFGSVRKTAPPSEAAIAATRQVVGSQWLSIDLQANTIQRIRPEMRLDLSAIAKGYAIDQLGSSLEQLGIDDYLIEFGGELRAGAGGSWTVGIERPDGSMRKKIPLRGQSIATSGVYRLGTHIIDPRTGHPAGGGLVAASVIAHSAVEADAIATALMVMGESAVDFAEQKQFSATILTEDGRSLDTGDFAD